MSNPYIGEIRMFAGNFAPVDWMKCEGQLLPIAQYDVLFVLLGTTYGGDGQTTFALPDLRSRIPIHQGTGAGLGTFTIGEAGGSETVTLTTATMPSHTHPINCSSAVGTSNQPSSTRYPAATNGTLLYADTAAAPATLNPTSVGSTGSSQPFSNIMPVLAINFIISLYGIFPSQG